MTDPLTKFLQTRYSETEAAEQAEDIKHLVALRNDACSFGTSHHATAKANLKYLAQIQHLEQLIPVSDSDAAVAFAWVALGSDTALTQCSWTYEKAVVLYNLAAMYAAEAIDADRSDEAGGKAAKTAFLQAASALQYCQENAANHILGSVPPELSQPALKIFTTVCQAQAQVCMYEIAKNKGMKAASQARIASHASALYESAYKMIKANPALESLFAYLKWVHYLAYQGNCFRAVAQFKQAMTDKEASEQSMENFGLCIRRATMAEESVNYAIATPDTTIDTSGAEGLRRAILEFKAAAVEENNSVYMQGIPEASEVDPVAPYDMAKIPPFTLPSVEDEGMGPGLFTLLIPRNVSESAAAFAATKGEALNALKGRASEATTAARSQLAELGLPGVLDAQDSASGVGDRLWEKIQRVQTQGGVGYIDSMIAANAHKVQEARQTLQKTEAALDADKAADDGMRSQYGARWTAVPTEEMTKMQRQKIAQIRAVLGQAEQSDGEVARKLAAHREGIANLEKTREELSASVPTTGSGPLVGRAAELHAKLKGSLQELEDLLSARDQAMGAAGELCDPRAVGKFVMSNGGKDNPTPIITRYDTEKMAPAMRVVDDNVAKQQIILDRIQLELGAYKEAITTGPEQAARNNALQAISTAVEKFDELRSNVQEGGAFYDSIVGAAKSQLQTATDMGEARALQRQELLLNLKQADEQRQRDEELARSLANMGSQGAGGAGGGAGAVSPPTPAYAPATMYQPPPAGAPGSGGYPGSAPPPGGAGAGAGAVPYAVPTQGFVGGGYQTYGMPMGYQPQQWGSGGGGGGSWGWGPPPPGAPGGAPPRGPGGAGV